MGLFSGTRLFEREAGAKRDGVVQRAIERAMHGVEAVEALDGVANTFGRDQAHDDVNAPYDQDVLLGFHFAGNFADELPITGVNLTRLQRASEGAEHSTG